MKMQAKANENQALQQHSFMQMFMQNQQQQQQMQQQQMQFQWQQQNMHTRFAQQRELTQMYTSVLKSPGQSSEATQQGLATMASAMAATM